MKKLGLEKETNGKFDKASLTKQLNSVENANFTEEQIERIVDTLLADKQTISHSELKSAIESNLSNKIPSLQ